MCLAETEQVAVERAGSDITLDHFSDTSPALRPLGIFGHRNGTSPYFCDEGGAKPRLLVLIVLRRVIEFPLGQLVERDAHSLDPGPRLSKDFVCLAA